MNEATNPQSTSCGPPAPVPGAENGAGEPANAERPEPAGDSSAYRLADPEPPREPPSPPSDRSDIPLEPRERTETTFQASTDEGERQVPGEFPDPAPEVSQVWTRWIDWTEPFIWASAGITLAVLIAFQGVLVATVAFLLAISYGAYCVVTSLEIPVRVTPEQAIQEFYAAAGHRLPNFHRMYGLLTDAGKRSIAYTNFAQFRAYWKPRIARFTTSPVWLVPLEFRVEGFKCRYNGEKTLANVRYVVKVAPRGRSESARPAAEFEMRNLVVKGPDGQWYLNDGTLPENCQE